MGRHDVSKLPEVGPSTLQHYQHTFRNNIDSTHASSHGTWLNTAPSHSLTKSISQHSADSTHHACSTHYAAHQLRALRLARPRSWGASMLLVGCAHDWECCSTRLLGEAG
jgi:hypothetical protein